MTESCFVCVIKPLVYFTYFSYGFVDIQCPHGYRATDKPLIRFSPNRWRLTLIFHLVMAALGALTLYLNLTLRKFNYFSLLTNFELVFLLIGVVRLIRENIGWRVRLNELQLMLCIWNHVGTFKEDRRHFFLSRKCSVGIVVQLLSWFIAATPHFFFAEVTFLTYLNVCVRLYLGMTVTVTYLYSLYEFALYNVLFRWTFEQIQVEVEAKLASSMRLAILDDSNPDAETCFSRRLGKLRRLYIAIVCSFRRMKKIRRSYLVSVLLIYHFLLILIFFLVFIVVKGELSLNIGNYLYVVKNFAYSFILIGMFFICDDVQDRLRKLRTVMFKMPLNALTASEAREVEVLTKFLAWEEPTDMTKDMPVYRMNLLLNLVLGVITNTMVVIQLYYWIPKQA